jgi:ribosomal protein L7/L12
MNQDLSPEQLRVVVDAIQRGSKIEAIKHYREATGLGLAESKDAVEAMAEALPTLSVPPPIPQLTRSLTGLTPEKRNAVIGAIRRGQKIEAIKIYREATGLGLAESKDAVEAMETSGDTQGNGPTFESRTPLPHWDPLAEKKKGCFGMIAVLVAVVAGVVMGGW